MPWFPDFVSAGELARQQTRDRGRADPVGQYFSALNHGDARTLETAWPGQVVVYDPSNYAQNVLQAARATATSTPCLPAMSRHVAQVCARWSAARYVRQRRLGRSSSTWASIIAMPVALLSS